MTPFVDGDEPRAPPIPLEGLAFLEGELSIDDVEIRLGVQPERSVVEVGRTDRDPEVIYDRMPAPGRLVRSSGHSFPQYSPGRWHTQRAPVDRSCRSILELAARGKLIQRFGGQPELESTCRSDSGHSGNCRRAWRNNPVGIPRGPDAQTSPVTHARLTATRTRCRTRAATAGGGPVQLETVPPSQPPPIPSQMIRGNGQGDEALGSFGWIDDPAGEEDRARGVVADEE